MMFEVENKWSVARSFVLYEMKWECSKAVRLATNEVLTKFKGPNEVASKEVESSLMALMIDCAID